MRVRKCTGMLPDLGGSTAISPSKRLLMSVIPSIQIGLEVKETIMARSFATPQQLTWQLLQLKSLSHFQTGTPLKRINSGLSIRQVDPGRGITTATHMSQRF